MPRYLPPVHFPLPPTAVLASLGAAWRDRGHQEERALAVLGSRFPGRSITLTDSGTSALSLAISASAVMKPARAPLVALPAYGCPDLGTAAVGAGAHVVLYDLDPGTLQPDFDSVGDALAAGATHVVIAHLYGRAADVGTARLLAAATGAIVIEDAAQGADAFWGGVSAGNLADWSILSLGRGKGYNAGGGGILLGPTEQAGRVLPDDAGVPTWRRELRHSATAMLTQWLSHPALYGIPAGMPALGLGDTRYHPPSPPTRITRGALSLLGSALQQSARAAEARRRREQQYRNALHACPGVQLPVPHPSSVSGALRVPVLVEPSRAAPLHHLGVVRSYPRTLEAYPEIATRVSDLRSMPGARQLAALMHTLPTHQQVRARDIDRIVQTLTRQP